MYIFIRNIYTTHIPLLSFIIYICIVSFHIFFLVKHKKLAKINIDTTHSLKSIRKSKTHFRGVYATLKHIIDIESENDISFMCYPQINIIFFFTFVTVLQAGINEVECHMQLMFSYLSIFICTFTGPDNEFICYKQNKKDRPKSFIDSNWLETKKKMIQTSA